MVAVPALDDMHPGIEPRTDADIAAWEAWSRARKLEFQRWPRARRRRIDYYPSDKEARLIDSLTHRAVGGD